MEYNIQKYMKTIELDKVLEILAEKTACEDAADAARNLIPVTEIEEAQQMLSETDTAYQMMARFGAPSFYGLQQIVNSLRRAQSGGVLNLAEFLSIAGVLRAMRGIVQWRKKSEGLQTILDWRFDCLTSNPYLEDKINQTVASEEEVADTASSALADIRRKMRHASQKVREQLDNLIRSSSYQKYLQDQIVTMRGGRYVVPVKAEYRGEVPGLVHDTSSSGATLFIEPMSVVEANNEIRVLQSKEKDEIERILTELSAEVGQFADDMIVGYDAAVQLNVIFAKADLAYTMKATMPQLNQTGTIQFKQARHPLLNRDTVVPTDIVLGKEFDTLMITGPNTGGKTVTLKTIGLLSAMAMCGLMLPVAEGSQVSVFRHILVDIGDEQSIEQSLSTFSSHMTKIIHIIEQADDNSLVLLDELGAGTDPIEGAALAIAILEHLRKQGCKIAATTHYAELKEYALQTDGVENACCEFDVQTLRPTYRLLIGVPGRSNAFAISKRLGIEDSIIQRAKELVSAENTKFEDVVRSLEETRQKLEEEKAQAEALRLQAVKANESAQEQKKRIEANAAKEIEIARRQASNLVARTRAQIDALMEEMDQLRKQKSLTPEQKAKLNRGIRALEDMADPVHKKEKEDYVLPRPLKIGDTVLIFDIDKQATVIGLSKNSDQVEVQAGIMKTRVPLSNLRLMEQEKVKTPQPVSRRGTRTDRAHAKVVRELDIRGQTAMEALLDVDNFIDAAVMADVHQLSIIHGKGTGVLRAAVQQHLKKHPSVKSYRLGVFGEGESGVTIVELK
ncbi:MAG: endonuclease MutS2 [Clostridium sp.]|nr:endonuclease MutS2 [Clostridium sp.]